MRAYLRNHWWPAVAAALTLCLALVFVSRATGPDNDGMSDAYELFFGLNPSVDDASSNYDSDALDNIDESVLYTDPFRADTDADGWNDDVDRNAVSRALIPWGDPRFTATNNTVSYTWPAWMISAWAVDGSWQTNPYCSWQSSYEDGADVGSVNIDVDRALIGTNNLMLSLDFYDHTNSSMYIDLYDTNDVVTATNLYGNLSAGADADVTLSLEVPFVDYSSAVGIHLRKGVGEMTIYRALLYIDADLDGLDADQEAQLGTSDHNADTDGDGISDYDEVFTYGTNPLSRDTDGDGLSDLFELSFQSSALSPLRDDTDLDGIGDAAELSLGKDPAVSNNYTRLPFSESFELPAVHVGELAGQNNWEVDQTNVAFVQSNHVYEGRQAMSMSTSSDDPASISHLFADADSVVWVDFMTHAIPAAIPTNDPNGVAVVMFNDDGYVVVLDGNRPPNDHFLVVTNAGPFSADDWVRLSLRLDYSAQEWLLCVNGVKVADGLAFLADAPGFTKMTLVGGRTELDAVFVGTVQPDGFSIDGDNLPDGWEMQYFTDLDEVDSGDPDGDGLSNLQEYQAGSNPTSADSDNDGMPDGWEAAVGLSATNSADAATDRDNDGLNNLNEYQNNTDPNDIDSDDDGLSDGAEVNTYSSNPLLSDSDGDGYSDAFEVAAGTDPVDALDYPSSVWLHHLKISIRDDLGVTNAVTGLPVPVKLNKERMDYSQCQPDGSDLYFDAEDGTPLDYELASWDTNGESIVWVRMPELFGENGTPFIHMHWGSENMTNNQNAAGVWSNGFAGVWHFDEIGSVYQDATGKGNASTNIGTVRVPGMLGHARDFEGADSIMVPPAALAGIQNNVTISFWQYGDTAIQPQADYCFEARSAVGRELNVHLPWNNANVYWDAFGNNDRINKLAQPSDYEGQWNHWTFTKDRVAGAMKIYLNGQLWHSGTGKTKSYTPVTSVRIGAAYNGSSSYDGIIDEFFVSDVARSAAWIKAQYLAMTDSLLLFGEQAVSIEGSSAAEEPDADGTFTVYRSNARTNLNLTVNYSISGGSALTGTDYSNLPCSVTIPAQALSADVSVTPINDLWMEGAETVELTLLPGDYVITSSGNSAQITINDSDVDTDSDGMSDAWELLHFGNLDQTDSGDTDADGSTNLQEYRAGTNPNDTDFDNDGLPDGWEMANGLNPLVNDADDDPDGDGLTNAEEYQYGFNPHDGISDNDHDGLLDVEELYLFGTSPLTNDSDRDGTNDLYNVLLIDGTNTTSRFGSWTNQGPILAALADHTMRAEYALPVAEAGMYRLALDITNTYTKPATGATFRVQLLIDGIRVGWLTTPQVSGLSPQPSSSYLTTPWLTTGQHTLRIAWLDDSAPGKRLGIERVMLQRVDGVDKDLNGIADWEEWMLDKGGDTDGDGLSDLSELSFQVSGFIPQPSLSPLSPDTDGDTIDDRFELTAGLSPLTSDSDADGIPDAYLIGSRQGVETSYRQVQHITTVWKEDGSTLYDPLSGILISYHFTVTTAGMYRVAFDLRNRQADPPDDYRFNVQVYVNGFSIGTRYVFADVDRTGTGYINTPWLTPGTHTISLKWLNKSDAAGRFTTIAVEQVRLYGFDAPDANADGIQDWQAVALQTAGDTDGDGLSDLAEITIYGTSPVLKDTDGDGLSDKDEINAVSVFGLTSALNPLSADTDGDGVSDWQEINETLTDPVVAEFGDVEVVDVVAGSDFVCASSNWYAMGTGVIARYRRGLIEYEISCPTGDVYFLEVTATHLWRMMSCTPVVPTDSSDLLISVDGVYVGKRTLMAPSGVDGKVGVFMPWLGTGTHRVRIFWENVHEGVSLKLKRLSVTRFDGPDGNQNGVRDWLEVYLSSMTGVDSINTTSVVSPICLEGDARYVSLTRVSTANDTNSVTEPSTTGRWYSNVALAPTGSTDIAVSFQNGSLKRTTNVIWTALNVLEAGSQMIRKGDALKLTALPAGATNGTVTIGVGDTSYETDVLTPVIIEFTEAGSYTVSGSYTPADGALPPVSRSLVLTVVEAAFPINAPACMIGQSRIWSCPDIPPQAVLQSDSTVVISGTKPTVNLKMTKINRDHYIVARLGRNGPILARQRLDGFWVQAAVDGYVQILKEYATSQVWEQYMVTKQVPDSVDIEISIFVGGVTFADDMTTTRWIAADALNELGEYTFEMIHPNSVGSSVCHRIKAYENGLYLGEAYYSEVLMPLE